MKRLLLFTSVAMAALGIASCGSDPVGSAGGPVGKLSGTVILYDHYGRHLSDFSGVTITLEGTGYKATTDASGKWAILNLPTSTYAVTISKPGFRPHENPDYAFVGGGEDRYGSRGITFLDQLPPFTITNLAARWNDSAYTEAEFDSLHNVRDSVKYYFPHLEITTDLSAAAPADLRQTAMLLMGTRSPVTSPSNSPELYTQIFALSPSTRIVTRLSQQELRHRGFGSGTTLHLAVYPGSFNMVLDQDPIVAMMLPLNITTPSNEVSITIP